MNRITFKNMGSDIYGKYIVKNGITSFTRADLSKAVIKFDFDLLIITINGNSHFVQSNNEFKSFWNKLNVGFEFESDFK
tara:strand:- start:150 stop:386 length:237 start_codon:yes stop_codon:yes gene_type:complete